MLEIFGKYRIWKWQETVRFETKTKEIDKLKKKLSENIISFAKITANEIQLKKHFGKTVKIKKRKT